MHSLFIHSSFIPIKTLFCLQRIISEPFPSCQTPTIPSIWLVFVIIILSSGASLYKIPVYNWRTSSFCCHVLPHHQYSHSIFSCSLHRILFRKLTFSRPSKSVGCSAVGNHSLMSWSRPLVARTGACGWGSRQFTWWTKRDQTAAVIIGNLIMCECSCFSSENYM